MTAGDLPLILLVAADDAARQTVVDILQHARYAVALADTARVALSALGRRNSRFGGVVIETDVGEPQAGWRVARRAREVTPDIPVIFIGHEPSKWMSYGVPRSVLLQEPFAAADLVVALRHLRNSRAEPRSSGPAEGTLVAKGARSSSPAGAANNCLGSAN